MKKNLSQQSTSQKINRISNSSKLNKWKKYQLKRSGNFWSKFTLTKNLVWTIPFAILTILLVIVPVFIVLIKAFQPAGKDLTVADNWAVLTGTVGEKVGKSIYIGLTVTIFTIILSYPFCYFLSFNNSKTIKTWILLMITAPIWTNFLIKLIGIKSIFDLMGGSINATHGDIFTILGLTYLYLPFMMMPLYTTLEAMPRNLINASKDLGRSSFYTFFAVVVPYTKVALFNGIILVLLPSLTAVATPTFLNHANDSGMIGNIIMGQGEQGLSTPISLARTSVLALVVGVVVLGLCGIIIFTPKIYTYIKIKISCQKLIRRGVKLNE